MTSVTVTHDREIHRFEARVDGRTAELDYVLADGRMTITHTGVPRAIGGRGIAAELVATAVAFARDEDLTVVPQCWYAAQWLDRHPEEAATITLA